MPPPSSSMSSSLSLAAAAGAVGESRPIRALWMACTAARITRLFVPPIPDSLSPFSTRVQKASRASFRPFVSASKASSACTAAQSLAEGMDRAAALKRLYSSSSAAYCSPMMLS